MRIGQKLSIPLFVIATGNLIDNIYRGDTLFYYIMYVLIFVLFGICFLFTKREPKNEIVSMVLLFLSLIGFWFGGDSSLIGTTLLMFSIYLSKNKKALVLYGSISLALMIIKFTFTHQNPAQVAVYLAGSSFIFILYHHYIHPKKENHINRKVYNPEKINSDVVDIVHLRVQGFDWPEINDKLELNVRDAEVPRKVRRERLKHGFKTQDQFVYWLVKECIIMPKKTEAELAAEKRDNL